MLVIRPKPAYAYISPIYIQIGAGRRLANDVIECVLAGGHTFLVALKAHDPSHCYETCS